MQKGGRDGVGRSRRSTWKIPHRARGTRSNVGAALLGLGLTVALGCGRSVNRVEVGSNDGTPAPPPPLTGLNPTEALPFTPVETVLGEGMDAPPFTDSENRVSCGDQPVGDLYATDPAVSAEAQKLLSRM